MVTVFIGPVTRPLLQDIKALFRTKPPLRRLTVLARVARRGGLPWRSNPLRPTPLLLLRLLVIVLA